MWGEIKDNKKKVEKVNGIEQNLENISSDKFN